MKVERVFWTVLFSLIVVLAVVLAAPLVGATGWQDEDVCLWKPWKPECQTTTSLPPTTVPETTTTTVETTTTTVQEPEPPVVLVSYEMSCPTLEQPAGSVVVTADGTPGTVVDVMGQQVTVPGAATFDLPAGGFVFTFYVDWDGGSETITDLPPECPVSEPPVDDTPGEVQVYPPHVRERLPVTGGNVARALVGLGAVVAGGVALWVVKTCDENEPD